jgi:signal peptidase I
MRRRDPPEDDPDEDDEDEAEETKRAPRRRASRPRRPPPKAWSDPEDGDDDEEADDTAPARPRRRWRPATGEKEPVYFRARDSVFFEPLIALAAIVLILVALFAYTQNWPPLYVVESMSMQHGTVDQVGLINTGDLVLAQKVSLSAITPYVVGMTTGYSTYGEYGDVLLYQPDGIGGGTPIIHRALVYLTAGAGGTFSAPELAPLPCGSAANWVFSANSSTVRDGCATTGMTGVLTLRGIGWQSVFVQIDLASVGSASGFVTMGDNNIQGHQGIPDEPGLTSLVQPGWIVGVARGMLPWFGAVKLLLSGDASEVPAQSWEYMGLTIAGLIGIAFGFHYLLRAEGIEDPRRKAQEEADEEEEPDEGSRSGPRRSWRHPLRGWRDEDDDEEDEPASEKGGRKARTPPPSSGSGGRPRPRVGHRSSKADDDGDEL